MGETAAGLAAISYPLLWQAGPANYAPAAQKTADICSLASQTHQNHRPIHRPVFKLLTTAAHHTNLASAWTFNAVQEIDAAVRFIHTCRLQSVFLYILTAVPSCAPTKQLATTVHTTEPTLSKPDQPFDTASSDNKNANNQRRLVTTKADQTPLRLISHH